MLGLFCFRNSNPNLDKRDVWILPAAVLVSKMVYSFPEIVFEYQIEPALHYYFGTRELKMDGWRWVAYIEDGECEVVSRNGNVYKSFARLANEVATLPVKNAILDAEVVCLDDQGRSVFLDLMRRRKAEAILHCFDLLWLD